jgi:RNA polymerase sigma-70 factor (ECF subfamily)
MPSFPPPSSVRVATASARAPAGAVPKNDGDRVRSAMLAHYDAIWRFSRRLGVRPADVEDCVQKVFVVLARRIGSIEPGAERSFLFASAVRVASDARKQRARSRERLAEPDETIDAKDDAPSAETHIDDRRLRKWLDEVLDTMSEEHRIVLVLVDIEEQTMAQACEVLGIPQGTVASRLRRAREIFQESARALKAMLEKEV